MEIRPGPHPYTGYGSCNRCTKNLYDIGIKFICGGAVLKDGWNLKPLFVITNLI